MDSPIKCPECGNTETIWVTVETMCLITYDGNGCDEDDFALEGQSEYVDIQEDKTARCNECEHEGAYTDFKVKKN